MNIKKLLSAALGRWVPVAVAGSCALLLVAVFAGCDNRNIHQVVRDLAAAPVDTVGWPGRAMHTNPFSAVDIDCFADVTYHQTAVSDEHYIELKAPGNVLENLSVKVEDGELRVAVDRRYRMPEKAVAVIHVYAPFVNRFILDSGKCLRLGRVELTCPLELMLEGNVGTLMADSIVAHEVSLLLDGTGSYQLKGLRTGDIRARVLGGGLVRLEGNCRSAHLQVRSNGKIDVSALHCDSAVVEEIGPGGKVVK